MRHLVSLSEGHPPRSKRRRPSTPCSRASAPRPWSFCVSGMSGSIAVQARQRAPVSAPAMSRRRPAKAVTGLARPSVEPSRNVRERACPPTPFYVAPSSIRVEPSSAQASSAGRTPARSVIRPSCPSPSLPLHGPPAPNARQRPPQARQQWPCRGESGSEARSQTREPSKASECSRSTYSGKRVYECGPIAR
jgi:hypothetical protein